MFLGRYIQKEFRHIVNGVEVVIPRDIPVLRDDAVPTVFPNLPKYISKALPKERKRRESGSHSVPPKKTSTEPEGSGSSQEDGTTAMWRKRPEMDLPSTLFITCDTHQNIGEPKHSGKKKPFPTKEQNI